MIDPRDITVVVQGDVRAGTAAALAGVRAVLPGATLVISTFEGEPVAELAQLVDQVVLSRDPGAQAHYTRSRFATVNNLNRQIVSTRAGMSVVRTRYSLKMRCDALLQSDAFLHTFAAVDGADDDRRLLACSFFTRHPSGISGYLFHVSDWFMFGGTPQMLQYWDIGPMTDDDATWFDRRPHRPGSTLAARRFRARYTPEQHLTIAYARRHGYAVPAFLNERTRHLVAEYRRFVASKFIIDTPSSLGFVVPKYEHVARSLYQAIDCIGLLDWIAECRRAVPRRAAPVLLACAPSLRQRLVRLGLRQLAHVFRHPLIALVQGRQKLTQILRGSFTPGLVRASPLPTSPQWSHSQDA